MSWLQVKSISRLSVSLETDSDKATIYGNGRHQIGVLVYIEALDRYENPVSIIPGEIIVGNTIKLVDYNTGEKLNWVRGGWSYTYIENDYHTIPGAGRAKRDIKGGILKYYVNCAPDERLRDKSIAVKVTLPNGQIVSTAKNDSNGFDSKVHLTALEEKIYTMDDMKLDREDTKDGNKGISATRPIHLSHDYSTDSRYEDFNKEITWDQDNYYFSIKDSNYYIKDADIDGYIRNEGDSQVSINAFYNRFPEDYQKLFYVGYIWDMIDNQQRKKVILYTKDHGYFNENIEIDIAVNQVLHAICLTRIMYKSGGSWRGGGIKEENLDMSFKGTNITIYDQYGNKSEFHARPDDDNGWGNYIKVLNGHS